MGLDVWFREDVLRVLDEAEIALLEASGYGQRDHVLSEAEVGYRRGWQAALNVVAAGFGVGGAPLEVRGCALIEAKGGGQVVGILKSG